MWAVTESNLGFGKRSENKSTSTNYTKIRVTI